MNLDNQIINQYSKRNIKNNLYAGGHYVENAQKEISDNIHILLRKEFIDFQNISLLEIGAGIGSNAKIFINIGIKLENICFNEILPERILAIKAHFPNNAILEGNAIDIEFNQKFDIVFQSTVFTSILSQVDRQNLANKLLGLLKPNGIILWYDFIYNNPKNKDVRKVDLKELKLLFANSSKICYKKITLAPPIGRKVKMLYKLFNVPFLRSHIIAIIKK